MWNPPAKERLEKIPRLYETEDIPIKDTLVYLHFHIFSSHWFITEYNGCDLFFGYAILNGDTINSEWGYVCFNDLKAISVQDVEITCEPETSWRIRPVSEVTEIQL